MMRASGVEKLDDCHFKYSYGSGNSVQTTAFGLLKMSSSEIVVKKITFVIRESALTTLFRSREAKALYSLLLSTSAFIYLTVIANYIADPSILREDVSFFQRSFGTIHYFFLMWIVLMTTVSFILYPASRRWIQREWERPAEFVVAAAISFTVIAVFPIYMVVRFDVKEIMSVAMALEQTRILLKTIAFVVETGRKREPVKDLNHNEEDDGKKGKPVIPTITHFWYFMFAPTLVYRDSYPRMSGPRNWPLITRLMMDILILGSLGFLAYQRLFLPRVRNFGIEPFDMGNFTSLVFYSIFVGWLAIAGIAYGFLHCWLNIWAELLRFGDRQFYRQWWLARGLSEFMRTWNYVVHSFIYEYLYKPTMMHLPHPVYSSLLVIALSVLAHDYVMLMATRVYYPLWILVFVFAMLPCYILAPVINPLQRKSDCNFCTFFVLTLWALIMGLFSGTGYFARQNCPPFGSDYISMELVFMTCTFGK